LDFELGLELTMSPAPALTKQKVGIPVYALDWLDNVTVVATGGGGAGKFGVANRIVRIASFMAHVRLCRRYNRTKMMTTLRVISSKQRLWQNIRSVAKKMPQ
jgi:predicted transcriptional regulator